MDDDIPCDEFECSGCGQHIISLPSVYPPPTRCATCIWIDTYISEADEREELRERLCHGAD